MTFALKPTHKAFKEYLASLAKYRDLGADNEGAVKTAFSRLLNHCARPFGWTLLEEQTFESIRVDGVFVDDFKIHQGYWEAKDDADDLVKEIRKKFKKGYPADNILFQSPSRVALWQNGREIVARDNPTPDQLVDVLREFFEFRPPVIAEWRNAVDEFKDRVPDIANGLIEIIEKERRENKSFRAALAGFTELCRESVNPNISDAAVEEMLIQHLLTERIFRKVFANPEFTRRNVIAREIEKVIDALASRHFSREEFLHNLDRFYRAIETTAAQLDDFSQKQDFLNTVYEKFFQGFSIKVADTHGIVYTPQPIVEFMVKSVDEILKKEFNRSLDDEGVHILDPFVGTGNFILHVMRHMSKRKLPLKYKNELHCNEVMLLPYYIASMNIEHEYFALTGGYEPFEGICLVDTFGLEDEEGRLDIFTRENTARVRRQRRSPIFVVIGNPPYNVGQVNENDNNKNRKYKKVDKRVADTYSKLSKATNKNALSDPYVKAFRYASDRIGDEGVIAFVSNNGFIDNLAFDGMRSALSAEFKTIYLVNLKGDVRRNPKISGTSHNVFGIQVGVSIALLVKRKKDKGEVAEFLYAEIDDTWKKTARLEWLDEHKQASRVAWNILTPDKKQNWLTGEYKAEFNSFVQIGSSESKSGSNDRSIFYNFSRGAETTRDVWVYNFSHELLSGNANKFIQSYNSEVDRWANRGEYCGTLDDFVQSDEKRIKWSSKLKILLNAGQKGKFDAVYLRKSLYRPFTLENLYFDPLLIHRRGQFPRIFPTPETEKENRVIWLKVGSGWPMFAVVVNLIPNLLPQSGSQCFPFYTYDEDGSNRRENITDWALGEFRNQYADKKIKKWDIFHYVYALLHHPGYRKKYEANLKRELPRIPFAPDFWAFAKAGKRLAEIHVGYESQPEYPLTFVETPGERRDLRVEKMRLSKDKTEIHYNEFLTLKGVPAKAFEYRLGHKSALDWVIDQYRVTTDKRSGIVNDPNREDDDEYIVRLIGKVITVSLETVEIVEGLPADFEPEG